MTEGIQMVMNDDGAFEKYDDTWDITIHCTSEEEQREVIEKINARYWIPADNPPEDDNYILLSFDNFSLPLIGRYEDSEDGGAYYLGDCNEADTCIANDLFVNAWMPLPEPYQPEKESE